MTKVKAKTDELQTPAILRQKILKLKMIAKLEKLIHVRKIAIINPKISCVVYIFEY